MLSDSIPITLLSRAGRIQPAQRESSGVPIDTTVESVRILPHIDAEMSAEPMISDCERSDYSGLGWLISMEK
jgi:hypothetical protein